MLPKAPPTSGLMTRTLCSGMPSTNAVMSSRMMCGVWLLIQMVYSSVPGSYLPIEPRDSPWVGDEPLVDEPLADHDLRPIDGGGGALLVARPPLEGHVARRVLVELGSPGRRAFSASTIAGSGSRSASIASSASSAWAGVSAMTMAMPFAGPLDVVEREQPGRVEVVGVRPVGTAGRPRARQRRQVLESFAGVDRDDAGHPLRGAGVDRPDARMGIGAAQDRRMRQVRDLDVVEVRAPTGDEPGAPCA